MKETIENEAENKKLHTPSRLVCQEDATRSDGGVGTAHRPCACSCRARLYRLVYRLVYLAGVGARHARIRLPSHPCALFPSHPYGISDTHTHTPNPHVLVCVLVGGGGGEGGGVGERDVCRSSPYVAPRVMHVAPTLHSLCCCMSLLHYIRSSP